jgi:hypothetical protein
VQIYLIHCSLLYCQTTPHLVTTVNIPLKSQRLNVWIHIKTSLKDKTSRNLQLESQLLVAQVCPKEPSISVADVLIQFPTCEFPPISGKMHQVQYDPHHHICKWMTHTCSLFGDVWNSDKDNGPVFPSLGLRLSVHSLLQQWCLSKCSNVLYLCIHEMLLGTWQLLEFTRCSRITSMYNYSVTILQWL